jgi:hypothetical protein
LAKKCHDRFNSPFVFPPEALKPAAKDSQKRQKRTFQHFVFAPSAQKSLPILAMTIEIRPFPFVFALLATQISNASHSAHFFSNRPSFQIFASPPNSALPSTQCLQ